MQSRCVLAAIVMIGFVLVAQSVRAQGGNVSASPASPWILPGPRVRSPLTVADRPIVAGFQSTRRERSSEGIQSVHVQLWGKFYRDESGNTRTDYFNPSAGSDAIAVSIIWTPQNKTVTFLSYADRTVKIRQEPHYPSEDQWMPGGRFALKPTNDERIIHGLECKRVILLPVPPLPGSGQAPENLQGETWVAFDWGLVMLDVMETPTEELRWEVVRVDRIEPNPSVFDIPEGFTVKQ